MNVELHNLLCWNHCKQSKLWLLTRKNQREPRKNSFEHSLKLKLAFQLESFAVLNFSCSMLVDSIVWQHPLDTCGKIVQHQDLSRRSSERATIKRQLIASLSNSNVRPRKFCCLLVAQSSSRPCGSISFCFWLAGSCFVVAVTQLQCCYCGAPLKFLLSCKKNEKAKKHEVTSASEEQI